MHEVVLDTETTGLNARGGDRIIEIGCVKLVDRVANGEFYHTYINPECSISPQSFAIHGISTDFLRDKPLFHEIVYDFLAAIKDAKLIIHNASFDLNFLNVELANVGMEPIVRDRVIDTLTLAQQKYYGKQNSLNALCKRYGINITRRTKHGALLDAELLSEVYVRLLKGRQETLALSGNYQQHILSQNGDLNRHLGQAKLPPKEAVTAEEAIKHTEFISRLGPKAVWKYYLNH